MSISLRYVSISDEAAGGSQVLFCLKGCGRTVSKEVFQSITSIKAI